MHIRPTMPRAVAVLLWLAAANPVSATTVTVTDPSGQPLATVMVRERRADGPNLDTSDNGYQAPGITRIVSPEITRFTDASGRVAFDELRQGLRDIEFLLDPAVGEVRVGCPEGLAAGFVPAVIERLTRQHPRVAATIAGIDEVKERLRRQAAQRLASETASLNPLPQQIAGQIIQLARHWAGPAWKTLSIPRGQSEAWKGPRPSA